MPAEQSGAAAKLEHAGRGEVRQQASQPRSHAALQIGMRLVGCRPARRSSGRRRRCGWRACAKSRTWRAHHSGCFRGSTWPPSRDQSDVVSSPDGLAHGLRHDGIVAGGKGEHRAGKPRPRLGLIPVHQPAESLVEPLDIQRLGEREGLGAAAAPEGLRGSGRLALEPAPHAGDPRRRDMEGQKRSKPWMLTRPRKAAPPPLPGEAARAARVNGRRRWRPRPVGRALGPTGDEAEIDERDFGAIEMRDTSRQIAALNPQPWTSTKCIFGVGRFRPSRALAKRGRRAR